MKATEFCYWLQGMFEINPPSNGLTPEQVSIIKAHLDMVFYHEIDKSYPHTEQKKLDELHSNKNSQSNNEEYNELIKKWKEEKSIKEPNIKPTFIPYFEKLPLQENKANIDIGLIRC